MSKFNSRVASTLRQPSELVAHGFASAADLPDLEKVAARYAVAVTPEVAALIDPNDPNDPIARQYIPSVEELAVHPSETRRSDRRSQPIRRSRASCIAIPTGCCSSWCMSARSIAVSASAARWSGRAGRPRCRSGPIEARSTISAAHGEIWEVILTGGDPLMLSPRRLAEIMADLAAIDHVRIIRLHTRIPVADPARVDDEMVAALKVAGAATWVALHANHPRELTGNARTACARMIDAGIPMVSQSVLLRGVNDDAATLEALMRAFVECRIKPYYLHHGDLAPGTAHLRTTLEKGQELMRALRGRVSGLCQPDYVLDIPGGHGKAPVGPNYLSRIRVN